jgi:hypothetical protein
VSALGATQLTGEPIPARSWALALSVFFVGRTGTFERGTWTAKRNALRWMLPGAVQRG